MIQSKARYTNYFKALTVFIFSLVIAVPVYFSNHNVVQPLFFVIILSLVVFSVLVFFVLQLSSKKILIDKDKIFVKFFLKAEVSFLLGEITEIRSASGASYAGVGDSKGVGPSRGDFFMLRFSDGSELMGTVGEYANFDELNAWLLPYGRQRGILKVKR